MNDSIRSTITNTLHDRHMIRSDLARAIKKTPQEVTRALNGTRGGGGVPVIWAAILDALDLDLVAVPRTGKAARATATDGAMSPAHLSASVDEAIELLSRIKAGLDADPSSGGATNNREQ